MADAAKSRALASAFELGLIDCLAAGGPVTSSVLRLKLGCDEKGLRMLLHLLGANEVIEQQDDLIRLTPFFPCRFALPGLYRNEAFLERFRPP